MSYYLYLMIITVNSCHHIFLRCWWTPLYFPSCMLFIGVDVTYWLQHLCNHVVWITCGLKKYDHIWLLATTSGGCHLIPWCHCTLNFMYCHYTHADCVQLNPPFQFGSDHSYGTRWPLHFQYSTSFGWKFFLNHKLPLYGTTYLTHCLIAHLLTFQIICMNIYLIYECCCMLL